MSEERVFLDNINELLEEVLQGKVEYLKQARLAKTFTEELIMYKNKRDLLGLQSIKASKEK